MKWLDLDSGSGLLGAASDGALRELFVGHLRADQPIRV
jgi:hypothetical protein